MKSKREIRWVKLASNGTVSIQGEPTAVEMLEVADRRLVAPMTAALARHELCETNPPLKNLKALLAYEPYSTAQS